MESKIQRFLDQYNIPYETAGRNVKKGNININCPFCDHDDGYHMGIIPTNGYYGCWRNFKHRGRNFARVIKALIDCSWEEAQRLAGKEASFEDGDDLMKMVDALFEDEHAGEEKVLGGAKSLSLLRNYKPIVSRDGVRGIFWKYLEGRGFTDIYKLVNKYEIYCCLVGEWKMRLVFPMYYNDKLITWQARSVLKDATLPYKDLSVEESVRHPKFFLYNFDSLKKGGKVLMVSEGLFDMLKLDYYSPAGFRATCLFTKSMTDEQMYLLIELAPLYEEVWLVLDDDAQGHGMSLASELFMIKNLKQVDVPEEIGDPGAMTEEEVKEFILINMLNKRQQ